VMGDAYRGENKTLGCFGKGVIGTIVGLVVMAILYPVITPARIGHGPPQCISKIKQLSVAQLIYAADESDTLPPYYSFDGPDSKRAFVEAIDPYAKNAMIYACPKSPAGKSAIGESNPVLGYEHFVLILRERGRNGLIELVEVAEPTRTAWMHDPIVKLEFKSDGEHIETYHGPGKSGFFVSFFDGHARWTPTIPGLGSDPMNTLGVWQK